jgi:hypothetical protein
VKNPISVFQIKKKGEEFNLEARENPAFQNWHVEVYDLQELCFENLVMWGQFWEKFMFFYT